MRSQPTVATPLVASVISFQLNATMVAPALRTMTTELGPNAFVAMSTYFYPAGAIASVPSNEPGSRSSAGWTERVRC